MVFINYNDKSYTYTKAKATEIRRRKPSKYEGESHTNTKAKAIQNEGKSHTNTKAKAIQNRGESHTNTKAKAIQIQRRKPYEGERYAKLKLKLLHTSKTVSIWGFFYYLKSIYIQHIKKIQVHIHHFHLHTKYLTNVHISELLNEKAKLQPPKGVAIRWAINADGEGGLSLILQALPATAASLNSRPAFKRDICPGLPFYTDPISVEIDYNNGVIGPKPRLFSTAPEITERALATSRSGRHNTNKGNFRLLM